jgi:glycosyltransferase involved in cell wall biosynthesis
VARELTFAISADYERATGGWVYNERLLDGLARLGWRIHRLALPAGFPNPSPAARSEAAALFRAIPDGSLVLVDQLCLGVLPEVAQAEARRLRLVMIVHHPLALESVRASAQSHAYAQSEREALRHVSAVLATSPTTARILAADYDVPPERIIVAVPGVDRAPLSSRRLSPGSSHPRTPEQADGCIPGTRPGMTASRRFTGSALNLLSVGAVVPRKDHGALVAALAGLKHLPWRLVIVGNTTRAPAHVAKLRAQISASGLTSRVILAGELPARALAGRWRGADLYVAASRHEGYGMAIAEALARGLPVVTTRAGAVGTWVGHRGALVVPDGNTARLRAALALVLTKPILRAERRRAALARRRALPSWEATAAAVHQSLQGSGIAAVKGS